MKTEVHTYAFSVAANAILSFFPFIVLLLTPMAMAMRGAVAALQAGWGRRGREIGFGVGIAQGYATLGQIGFAERVDYTAIGTVCNLAARLCDAAADGQILVSKRIAGAVEGNVRVEEIGELTLKGLSQTVTAYNVA